MWTEIKYLDDKQEATEEIYTNKVLFRYFRPPPFTVLKLLLYNIVTVAPLKRLLYNIVTVAALKLLLYNIVTVAPQKLSLYNIDTVAP